MRSRLTIGVGDAGGELDIDDRSDHEDQHKRDHQQVHGHLYDGRDVHALLLRKVLGEGLDLPGGLAHGLHRLPFRLVEPEQLRAPAW